MDESRRPVGELKLLSGNANRTLSARIAEELGQRLEEIRVERFEDGEVRVEWDCVVRGRDVFIIQPICQSHRTSLHRPCLSGGTPRRPRSVCTYQSINDNLVELLVMIDAARRASAGRITAVVPYMAYAKQEKKKQAHEPITAKLVANLITTAGADRLLTVDLHTPAIEGFFDIPVDHMRMALPMAAYFREKLKLEEAVVVSPDAGGVARATEFRDCLKTDLRVIARDEMAIAFKRRTPEGEPAVIDMVGKVKGRPAVVFDDMVQSGRTLLEVVRLLRRRGATEVYAGIVHADLTVGALQRLTSPLLKTVVLSDTTPAALEVAGERIQIVSTARMLAWAIWHIHTHQSVGTVLDTLKKGGELGRIQR